MLKSSRRAPVTPAEFIVLEALWDLGVGTVGAVHAALPRGRHLAYNTVLTQIRFLHAKGFVLREQVGRAHVYRARYDRPEVLKRVTSRFADDYFGGSLSKLHEHAGDQAAASHAASARGSDVVAPGEDAVTTQRPPN